MDGRVCRGTGVLLSRFSPLLLSRRVASLSAAADKANLIRARHSVDDFRRQPDGWLVVGEEGRSKRHLFQHRSGDLGMGMAHQHRPGPQQQVDIFATADIPHPAGTTLGNDDVRGQIAQPSSRQQLPCPFHQCHLGVSPRRTHCLVPSGPISPCYTDRNSAAAKPPAPDCAMTS